MKLWEDCRVENTYLGVVETSGDDSADVRIGDGRIVLTWEDDEGVVEWHGREHGEGHFELACPERAGRGTLHRFPGGRILEGFWSERGETGFWRVHLPHE